jgi:RNA polymerase sigma factor (sigma-70 family)
MKNQSNSSPFVDKEEDEENNNETREKGKSFHSSSHHSLKGKSDKAIWRAFQQNHEGAFSFIYDQYFETLYNYGCQVTRDSAVVEDLLQDFFVGLRLSKQKTSEVSCIKAYLVKSFRRKVIRHLKKKKIFFLDRRFSEGNFTISFHHDMQFMNTQFHKEQQKYIERMLNKLTRREREAIYYFYFENLDYESISQVMELSSAKSARNLIYKAMSSLKKNKAMFPKWLQYCILFWV